MKKLLIAAATLVIGLSVNAATYCWGLVSYDYLGPDGSGYSVADDMNLYSGGTAFLYLGTIAYDNGFVTDTATYIAHSGYDSANYGYGVGLDQDTSSMDTSAAVDAAGGQAYSIVLVDAAVSSLDDANIQNYIIITGTSGSEFDPGLEANYATFVDYSVIGGDGVAWTATSSAPPEPIPEPTSGLLVLLGVAGLALKRKKA